MASSYPTTLDTLTNPTTTDPVTSPSHSQQHSDVNDAVEALEAKVGIDASTPIASRVLRGTGTGTSAWAQLVLSTDVTGTLPVANGGTGAATLASNGVLLGNGTGAVAVTTAGAAYQPLRVPSGGGAPAFGAIDISQSAAVTGILGAANGGTGNGFTAFTGPTTSTRTFTLPNASATILTDNAVVTLAQGGTAANLTASNGGIVYSTASAFAILAGTATANKILMSGSSDAPVWSTPTYPNAAAGSRKMIVGDGTNFVQSTETWAVPGTSGNVLTSDGTNWTSATPASSTPRITFNWFTEPATYTDNRQYSASATGTGSVSNVAGGWSLNTGATNGSRENLTGQGAGGVAPSESIFDNSPEVHGVLKLTDDTSTAFVSWFYSGGDGGTFPSSAAALTIKHFGFILDTTTLNASNANGTTQTTTDISSGVTVTNNNTYRAVMSGSTNVKFYVNKTLKATHTTNLPSGAYGALVTIGIQNDAGVGTARALKYAGCVTQWDAA